MRFLPLIISCLLTYQSFAQESQVVLQDGGAIYLREEVENMSLFIEANQKKILGRYDDAISLYKVVLEREPLNAAAYHDLARIYAQQDELDLAISAAKKSVRFKPKNHWYKLTLIEILEQDMNHQEAASLIQEVLITHHDEDLYHRLADNQVKANQIMQAIATYDMTDQRYGIDEWRADTKVDLYLKLDKEKEALQEVAKWTVQYPESAEYWIKLARYHEFRGDRKKSIKAYQTALELEPSNEEALLKTSQPARSPAGESGLMAVLSDERIGIDNKIAAILPLIDDPRQYAEVVGAAKMLTQQYPNDAKSYAMLGDVYWLQGEVESASAAYLQSLEINKSVYQVWDHYMQSLALLGDNKRLLQWSSDALDYYPNQAGPYFFQALANYRTGKKDRVDVDLDEALFIAGSGDGYIVERSHMLRAQLIKDQKGLSEALTYLAELPAKTVGPSVCEYWGDLLAEHGDRTAAKQKYQDAIDRGGDRDRLNTKLSAL